MVMTDTISAALTSIRNASKIGKPDCRLKPASQVLGSILKVMQKEGYVGEYEFIDDGKSGYYDVKLTGIINDCGSIKPRHAVKVDEYAKFEERYLPGQNLGILLVSTPLGIMHQKEAIKRNTGGQLLAYVY